MRADDVPTLRADLLRSDLDGEAVLWSPIRPDPVALDPIATVMLDVIDGAATASDLSRDVHETIGVPLETAHAQVDRVLDVLDAAGALTSSRPHTATEQQRELFVNPPNR